MIQDQTSIWGRGSQDQAETQAAEAEARGEAEAARDLRPGDDVVQVAPTTHTKAVV